jgi:hypothetical protein
VGFNKNRWNDEFERKYDSEARNRGLGDNSLHFSDLSNREIKISPSWGLQVEDSEGTIIHDTPDCVIATSMAYGGHLFFYGDHATYAGQISVDQTDTNTSYSTPSSTTNTDISSYIPDDITKVRALLISANIIAFIDDEKTQAGCYGGGDIKYSLTYNTAPATHNYIARFYVRFEGEDADDNFLGGQTTSMAIIPVVYESDTPYIVWNVVPFFSGMNAQNKRYYVTANLYTNGFFV